MDTKWKKMCEKMCDKGWKRLILWGVVVVSFITIFAGGAMATRDGIGLDAFSCFGVEQFVGSKYHAEDVKAAFDEVRDKCVNQAYEFFPTRVWKFKGIYEFKSEKNDHLNKTNISDAAYKEYAEEVRATYDPEELEQSEDLKDYERDDIYDNEVIRLKKDKADWYFERETVCYYTWDGISYSFFGQAQEAGLKFLDEGDVEEYITVGFTEEMMQEKELWYRKLLENLYMGCALMAVGILVAMAVMSVLVTDICRNRRGRRYCDVMAACAAFALYFLRGHLADMISSYKQGNSVRNIIPEVLLGVEVFFVWFAAIHIICILLERLRHKKKRFFAGVKKDYWFFYRIGKQKVAGEMYYGQGIEECTRKRLRCALVSSAVLVFLGFCGVVISMVFRRDAVPVLLVVEAVMLGGIWHFYRLGSNEILREYKQLMDQVDEICDGRYQTHKMLSETSVLAGESRKMSMLGEQMREHVQKMVRAEKMRRDLITNLSHDLKTPLTSLISYIDLLAKEELAPTSYDYVKVLERKSEHLRKMIADVFDLAKASSGNMDIRKERVDLNRLLIQTLADMESEIEKVPVKVVTDLSEKSGILKSDGDKLYRVLQNVLENALKYSMPRTRVFVTLTVEKREAVIRVKNVSAYEMNFTAEEVLGRFFRGDKARSTEGSGLGLAIAKEFSELCDGTFSLDISGDVFCVEIRFVCHDVVIP